MLPGPYPDLDPAAHPTAILDPTGTFGPPPLQQYPGFADNCNSLYLTDIL